MPRLATRLLITIGVSSLSLVPCAAASAGESAPPIRYVECFANTQEQGCTPLPGDPLDSPMFGMATSPDGASLYVASEYRSLAAFTRVPSGDLTYQDCFADLGDYGCTPPALNSLEDPVGVAVSADGQSVYAISDDGSALTSFDRAPDGSLTYAGCVANQGRHGCDEPAHPSIAGPAAITVSPDDESVYVVGWDHEVSWFDRAPDGSLTYGGCFADRGRYGCEEPLQDSIGFALGVNVSPDGRSVYVAGGGDSITIFKRQKSGALVSRGCVSDEGLVGQGCDEVPHYPLFFAQGVVTSPDGRFVYALGDDDLAVFRRHDKGGLSFTQCFRAAGKHSEGCEPTGRAATHNAKGIAMSPDGKWVYITGAGSIFQFKTHDSGHLSYVQCVSRYAKGCHSISHDSLDFLWTLAISPDGQSLYASTDSYPPSIAHFELRKDPGRVEERTLEPNTVSFSDPGHAVLGTGDPYRASRGTIQLSDDGGQTFHVVRETDNAVAWVTTAGAQNAWAVLEHREKYHLLHSGDGGQTWDPIPGSPPPQPSFGTPLDGYAVDDMWDSRLLVTHDGGETWTRTQSPCPGAENLAVAMASADDVLIACGFSPAVGTEGKEIYASSDGGQTWHRRARTRNSESGLSGLDYIYGLSYSPSGAGLLFSYEPFITGDNGQHWAEADAPHGGFSGQMFSSTDGVLLDGKHLITTDNAGQTWTLLHHF